MSSMAAKNEQMMNIVELANVLGVTPAIIRSWQSNLGLKIPTDEAGEWIYDAYWQGIFKEIGALRKIGSSFNKIETDIRKRLNISEEEPVSVKPSNEPIDIRSFIPPAVKSSENVVRSSVSEKDLLGMYGPQSEENPEAPKNKSLSLAPDAGKGKTAFESVIEERQAQPLIPWEGNLKEEFKALDHSVQQAVEEKDMLKMMGSYVKLVESYQALSSRYSESTFKIGQLEEENRQIKKNAQTQHELSEEEIKQLKAHVGSLKKMLDTQEQRLDQQEQKQASKDEVQDVSKQVKLLTLTVLKAQEEQNKNFMARLKALFGRKIF